MTEYKAFSNTVVVFKEPTISQIVPKSGPNAGKETSVLEFKAYKPHFVKQKDGSFQQDKDGTEFFSVRYYGKECSKCVGTYQLVNLPARTENKCRRMS